MKAPDFTLADQDGISHSLADYAGKWLVVYFYPKDETPGCTQQACSFRDGRDMLAALGAEVVGISKDTVRSHGKFAGHHKLNFTLLSDPTADTIKAYGSWKKKKFMGREYTGISRDTYLINPSGELVKSYPDVDPASNIRDVLADLQQLTA